MTLGLFHDRLIPIGVAVEIALIPLIDHAPWGNRLFGTASISWNVWRFVAPFGLAMLLPEELRKILVRRS